MAESRLHEPLSMLLRLLPVVRPHARGVLPSVADFSTRWPSSMRQAAAKAAA